jgi:uncharacterized protein (DUF1697 family)
MPKYVALLRAINVGGHVVKMDRLRALFEALGFASVETFIASGNVIFDSPSKSAKALERKIEAHLREALGYEVATFVRSTRELAEVARHAPFGGAEEGTLYVCFLREAPGPDAVAKVMALATPVDEFRVSGREVYWLCRTRISDSAVSGPALAKALGSESTMRNSTTVRRLAAKYA